MDSRSLSIAPPYGSASVANAPDGHRVLGATDAIVISRCLHCVRAMEIDVSTARWTPSTVRLRP